MELRLLGPLLVQRDGATVPVPPGKQRVLLAALLLRANCVVPLDDLTEALWGHNPPPSVHATLRNHVKRLRRTLAAAGDSRIRTLPGGYLIEVDAGELDVIRFEALQGSAREAARHGSWDQAAEQLRTALSLWRGEPLVDVPSEWLALREVPRLAEMRLQAVSARIEADLQLGRHAEVIAELRQLTGVHPLRERLHALLMLALYRDSQQAEALVAYRRARHVLIEELGAEPGPELRQLEQRIITADRDLAPLMAPGSPLGTHGAIKPADVRLVQQGNLGAAVPRQLPATVRHFTGRIAELAVLTSMLDRGAELTVVILAIAGTAGVGKTALALRWAHQVTDRFPDGQLYVNLRGFDPGQPVAAPDALARFLRALGVAGQDIPADTEERSAMYRGRLAGRRVLVLLDNAGSAEQVRPLLPGTPGCAVLVTSRNTLAGLVARDGAQRLDLDLLSLSEAVRLLRTLIGDRADETPQATAELAAQCARLPLALRVAAELVAARPAEPLGELIGELADHHRRLDLLAVGEDPQTAVRAVFSWSYLHLDADAARMFRLLGLHPAADWEPYAAAALAGITLEEADRLLTVLASAHLIQPVGSPVPGRRYGLHDLLRAYAAEQAMGHDAEPDRRQALTRLFNHYLRTAAAAMDSAFPAEHPRLPDVPAPVGPVPPVADPAAAQAWLDAHRATLVAVAAHAADYGWPGHATRLATAMFRYLETGAFYSELVAIYGHAQRAARSIGDKAAEAEARNCVCLVDLRQGRYPQAICRLREALELYRQAGDQTGQAYVLGNLGIVDFHQGRYQQAVNHQRQALTLYRQAGSQVGQARTLNNLGLVELRQGRYHQAASHFRRALTLYRQAGIRAGQAYALRNLGRVELQQGRYDQADDHLRQALALFRRTRDPADEAEALTALGEVDLHRGRYHDAARHHGQALAGFREIGDRSGEAEALNGLGGVFLASGQPDRSHTEHAAALALASQIGDAYQQARAHDGLARSYHAVGNSADASRHWQQALILYTALGCPEADQVRAQLGPGQVTG